MKNKITLCEIAKKAGVSKSSVSLALKDRYGINSKTRAKILMVAYEMGYDFKAYYKSIGKKLKKIALLIAYESCVSEFYWKEIILEIEKEVIENGCVLDIINFNKDENYQSLLFNLKTDTCLGCVIIHHNDSELMRALQNENIKSIVIEPKYYSNTDCVCLMPNDYVGETKVADYLYKLGHRDICFLGNIFHNYTFMQRFNGFNDYFKTKKDVKLTAITDSNAAYSLQNTDFDKFESVFKQERCPTALVCVEDQLAIECVQRIQKLGKKVPEDVSVVGYGNNQEIYEFSPIITTTKFNRSIFGQFISDYLIKNKYGENIVFSIQIAVDLVENETTKRIL